ncbi:MAG TPA: NmrA family NAD(P)-binding protein, partial [Ignavibacteriaceae bacterium]|nr:NmrA family NAD(P)-binding protein [Ignavibacteriaceae bacterium]
ALGTVKDLDFLTTTFTGADAVYCMIPPDNYFDQNLDIMEYTKKAGENYKQAIEKSGIKRMVFLSSIGAHTDKGNGLLAFYFVVENILNGLPNDVAITFMRPVGFYYNLYAFVNTIKTQGVIASNYGGDVKKPWVSPIDIAAAVAEELVISQPVSRKVRYVASDEISCNDAAAILGSAIGKPDLKWIIIPDEELLKGMIAAGMNPKIATGLVEMNAAGGSGKLFEDYDRNKPVLGKTKLTEFAKEFAVVYKQK